MKDANERRNRVLIIGIGGPSCGGKTTFARCLKSILPGSPNILHQDDFYKTDSNIPIDPRTGYQNWDCPDAYDMQQLIATLKRVREGEVPVSRNSSVTDEEAIERVVRNPNILGLKELKDMMLCCEREGWKFILVEGILLYSNPELTQEFDVKFFISASYDVLKHRRSSRKGYTTLEGFWEDPPNYFDDLVWPEYVKWNSNLLEGTKAPDGIWKVDSGECDIETSIQEGLRVILGEIIEKSQLSS
ncbi:uncharacterized protein VTP21DRAFT_4327 [Calcarisporiella thermophila]|uniref:uncharacterized protein n=1 Tax=Calcarisporiella thermophila TaxID=911321 RepID=UPI00374485D4